MTNLINKINVSSDHAYRMVTNTLNNQNITWYSYENEQNRYIKLMIKILYNCFKPIHNIRNSSVCHA